MRVLCRSLRNLRIEDVRIEDLRIEDLWIEEEVRRRTGPEMA
jgi:hypothetical protein